MLPARWSWTMRRSPLGSTWLIGPGAAPAAGAVGVSVRGALEVPAHPPRSRASAKIGTAMRGEITGGILLRSIQAERRTEARERDVGQTGTAAPDTTTAASDARYAMTSATASVLTHPERSASGMAWRLAGVSMVLGRTAFTVMPRGASRARA